MSYKIIGFLLVLFISPMISGAQNIEVYITNIRSTDGSVMISIFKDQESFRNEKPFKEIKFKKTKMVENAMKVKITLEPGRYGLTLVDDENNNGEMDYNFLGMPKEGFGFSDFYLSGLSRPTLDDFDFIVKKDEKKKIIMKIRYL